MKKLLWLGLVLVALPLRPVEATGWRKDSNEIHVLNRRLRGKVVDHTANHGQDNRIWSRSLYQRRDLYVYLPPDFNPHQQYPLMIMLHGFSQDEQLMLSFAPLLDEAIANGKVPPLIVACPDGSTHGSPNVLSPGSFFLNTKAGDFEDFVTCDVWDFVVRRYPICPQREAHILGGVSMGGFAAYNLGIRHRNAYGIVVGIFPPLNLRWVDDKGNYRADFDPHHWGWRTELSKREVIGRFVGGLFTLRLNHLIEPLFGFDQEALVEISRQNPIELVDRTGLRNGDLAMYVAYAGRDEFNIDAQVESFLYLCKHRGISVAVGYDAMGKHDWTTAKGLLPDAFRWLSHALGPYASCLPGPESSPPHVPPGQQPELLPQPAPKDDVAKRLP